MTRATQVTRAMSAMRKARAAPSSSPEPESMTFLIYKDNVGGYHWRIVADGGETLVRSASFGSYEDAKQAARIVHRGASRDVRRQLRPRAAGRSPLPPPSHNRHLARSPGRRALVG
jgi:uncharacterized protein YegP (UPF0339 family)